MGGPFGNRGNTESREQTIANGKPLLLQCENLFSERFYPSVPIAAAPCVDPLPNHFCQRTAKSRALLLFCDCLTLSLLRQRDCTLSQWSTSLQKGGRASTSSLSVFMLHADKKRHVTICSSISLTSSR